MLTEYLRVMCHLRRGMAIPAEYNYNCVEDYVLDRGSEYLSTELTPDELKVVRAAMARCDAKPFVQKECFYNSQMLALSDHTNMLEYHEGYALGHVIPVHHGWCVINGKVVDLTWRTTQADRLDYTNRIYGVLPANWAYRGVRFDRDAVLKRVLDTGYVRSFIDDPWSGWPLLKQSRLSPVVDTSPMFDHNAPHG